MPTELLRRLQALRNHAIAVPEERVADTLLDDLAVTVGP
jgi:hypothetical protein